MMSSIPLQPQIISSTPGTQIFKNDDVPHYYSFYKRLEQKMISIGNHGAIHIGLIPKSFPSFAKNSFQLTDFNVSVQLSDAASVSVYTQVYKNDYTTPVEASYKMPLPPFAALSRFVVTYADKVLEGEIKEKEEAFNQYSDAIASGGQAFLAEKTDDGMFSLSIGNLPPREQVTVSLTIVSEVGVHLHDLHYCMHRLMFPSSPFSFSMRLEVELTSVIDSISLDNYPHTTKIAGNKAIVEMKHQGQMQHNVIAMITPKNDEIRPEYFVERVVSKESTSEAIGINFYPKFAISAEDVDQRSEFIFLLDCSGSMSGNSIAQARKTLQILMRSLTEKSKFNIYLFGSSYVSLFPKSVEYNDETLTKASTYISKIDANLGGTELLPPVRTILQSPYDPEYPRQLFILTDGEISERETMIDYVGKESNTTRIFTLGIGGGVDRDLVIGVSKACMGHYAFISDNSQMETQVVRLMSIAMEPTIANIKVNWGSLQVTQAPKIIRPIFNNERMMIYALVNKPLSSNPSDNKVIITCDGPSGTPLKYELQIDASKARTSTNSLHTLSAFQVIRDLEEDDRKANNKNNKDQVIKLGTKYNLVSKYTSFVVTVQGDKVTTDTMTKVNVLDNTPTLTPISTNQVFGSFQAPPTAPPLVKLAGSRNVFSSAPQAPGAALGGGGGGGMFQQQQQQQQQQPQMSFAPSPSYSPSPSNGMRYMSSRPPSSSRMMNNMSSFGMSAPPPPPPSGMMMMNLSCPPPPPPSGAPPPSYSQYLNAPAVIDVFAPIIAAQKADGSFDPSKLTGTSIKVSNPPPDLASLVSVWTTIYVIVYLTTKSGSQYSLVINKAVKWIKKQLSTSNLIDKYDQFLKLAKDSI